MSAMIPNQLLKVLLIEDDHADAELIREHLLEARHVALDVVHVVDLAAALQFLSAQKTDIILSDLGLTDSAGMETFIRVNKMAPQTPVIVLTGLSDEQTALTALQKGAQDYLVKDSINTHLLIRAILYAIERKKLLQKLENSLKEIRALKDMIPICAWCRKIRDDDGYWKQVESYLAKYTQTKFTHGICPDCEKKLDFTEDGDNGEGVL